jgi:NADPH:quinone reductase-like Zn-dependent oxidoreductase
MKAVKFDKYGGIEVLQLVEVPLPEPGQGEALVKVKATSINPGEAKIREGQLHARWPATFPSGEGSDVAGIVTKLGPGIDSFKVGAEVIGFTDRRASHAEYVLVEAKNLTLKPAQVSWNVAGSLPIAGSTAYAAVRSVSLKRGETVAISGAGGGVGSIAVQLAKRAGATVIGIASPSNHEWLAAHGIQSEAYGDGRCVECGGARGAGRDNRRRRIGSADRRDVSTWSGSNGLLAARARTYSR